MFVMSSFGHFQEYARKLAGNQTYGIHENLKKIRIEMTNDIPKFLTEAMEARDEGHSFEDIVLRLCDWSGYRA